MKVPPKQRPGPIRQSRRRAAAIKGIQSKVQSGEPPHINFMTRNRGSLPTIIGQDNLEKLNSGLDVLFNRLRVAKQEYDVGTDGGRVGAFTALGAVWQFITLFDSPRAEGLYVPILKLQDALVALDQNDVLPILKPVRHAGRAPSSHAYTALKGHAAATVMRLRKSNLDPKQACVLVARELAKLGVRPDRGRGGITATTVRHWCDEVENDVGRRGTAATIYDMMFTDDENKKFDALPHDRAKAFTLDSLRHYVREIFPEIRVTEKPS